MKPYLLPPLFRTPSDAERFARIIHEHQTDAFGRLYVEHLERVAKRVLWSIARGAISPIDLKFAPLFTKEQQEAALQIAWLHDVVEQTEYGEEELLREGFSRVVVDGVSWLTARGNEPYATRIARLREGAPVPVCIVKLADIEDDSDPERLAHLDDATRSRLERQYGPAKQRLEAAIADRIRRA